uniref:Alternative protein n=1 Tax=Panagrellus redivivus TaxID=6233 RepID=A0A7E4URZ2_PANRE
MSWGPAVMGGVGMGGPFGDHGLVKLAKSPLVSQQGPSGVRAVADRRQLGLLLLLFCFPWPQNLTYPD